MSLPDILNSIYPLPPASCDSIALITEKVSRKKGELLFSTERTEHFIYFISRGIVRAFINQDEREFTFWFGLERDVVISMKSYIYDQPGYEYIELLEDSELYRIDARALQQLYLADSHIANWGRKLAEQELVRTEERLIARQFKTALERYKELLTDKPELLQRVPLGYIASYLGITQVSLSRIRAGIK